MASEIDACMQNACRKVLEDFDFNLGHEQFLNMTNCANMFVAMTLEVSTALYQSG